MAFIDSTSSYARVLHLPNVRLYIQTCSFQCKRCSTNYYLCDSCKNSSYAKIKDSDNSLCYPITMRIEGFKYNSNTKYFEKCYESCQFCSELAEDSSSSTHNCESCKEGYAPSYQHPGNCYKINENEISLDKDVNIITDESFTLVDSCPYYKINFTGECISTCPTSSSYYNFVSNNINITDLTISQLSKINYIITETPPPKYLFNNICYESCPLLTYADDTQNKCFCKNAYHIENGKLVCYESDYCINNSYKYYLNDTKECISATECPSGYYQFNFQCYKDNCPDDTEINSNKCISKYNYCYVNEYFQTICNENQQNGYIYKYDNTVQYLKSCEESLIYTTPEQKTYLYNNICYLKCPEENTKTDEASNICICSYFYYKFKNNNTLNCFENSISCKDKNYLYYNPDSSECYDSLQDCFDKGNSYYFNNYCFLNQCPTDKIPLSSTSKEIQNYFINELLLNDSLIDKLCICDIINSDIKWNKTELNEIECLQSCLDDYEPESLTHKCIEKCNPNKDFNFNDNCYKDGCPSGTKLNTTENESTKKICICEDQYYINETNNYMVCINYTQVTELISTENQNEEKNESSFTENMFIQNTESSFTENQNTQIVEPSSIENKDVYSQSEELSSILSKDSEYIQSTDIISDGLNIQYPEEYFLNPDNCLAVYRNECYIECPNGTCITPDDPNLVYCVSIKQNYYIFNGICFADFNEIINNLKNISEINQTISKYPLISISVYTKNTLNNLISNYKNLSIIYLNGCEDLLIDFYNLTNDTILYIIGIDSPNKNKSYVVNVYNYLVLLENGFQLDHLNICKDTKITISSPIINNDSLKIDEANYFSTLGYDIYNINDIFYNDHCSSASINGNDITLTDRMEDFFPSNYSLCNESCEYDRVDLSNERTVCQCNLTYNFSQSNGNYKDEDEVSYLDYFLSYFNYKIISCYHLLFKLNNYINNIGFYLSIGTILFCFIQMIIFIIFGINNIKKNFLYGIPNKFKLKKRLENSLDNKPIIKKKKTKNKSNINFNFIYINQEKGKNPPKKNINIFKGNNLNKNKQNKKVEFKTQNSLKEEKPKKEKKRIKTESFGTKKIKNKNKLKIKPLYTEKKNNKNLNIQTNIDCKNIFNLNTKMNKNSSISFIKNYPKFKSSKKIKTKQFLEVSFFGNDKSIDSKEINHVPYTQALRIDQRDCLTIFISILSNELELVSIFYYKNKFIHLSLTITIYLFESLLDITLNCFFYNDDYISEKYENGNLKFLTSITISAMSNIISNIISYYISSLINYGELLEMIIKNVVKKKIYFLNMAKFKKLLVIKLIFFYSFLYISYFSMFYYITIFCTVYSKTQKSFLINYFIGMAESILISLLLSIITSSLRYISLSYRIKILYNTSRYLFEKF